MRRIFPRCWFNEATTEAGSDAPGYYHECDNPWFPSVLDEETLDLEKYPDRYSHVWLGDYARAFEGAYYASVLAQARAEGRIGKVAADRDPSASTVWTGRLAQRHICSTRNAAMTQR